LIALFVYFYKTPELSLLKHQTATRIAKEIRTEGFEVSERMGGTSMVAITKNGTGPMVMVRAHMDGLPLFEKNRPPPCVRSHSKGIGLR
jgi:hippurate hydrolase